MNPTFVTYLKIPGYIILYFLLLIALGIFVNRVRRLYGFLRLGGKENRFDDLRKRVIFFLTRVLGQWCTLRSISKKDLSGMGHFFMFWAFVLFFVNYAYLFIWGGWHKTGSLTELGNVFSSVFSSLLEFLALLAIGAVIWALCRRYLAKAERLERGFEPAIILILVFLLLATHFVGEAIRMSLFHEAHGGTLSSAFSVAFGGFSQSTRETSYYIVWWFHIFILFSFLVYIPYSKHLHIFASLFNVFFRSLGPKGALPPIDIETAENLGVGKIEQFTWKQLLDLYACAECGRCQASCPAYLSGKPLSPQQMIRNLKNHLIERGRRKESASSLIGGAISEEEIWDCLTCYACQEVCPVSNEHIHKINELRRNLVLMDNKIPETAERALRTLMMRGDPWTGAQYLRMDWTDDLDVKVLSKENNVDLLFWVGCTGALDERNMKVTISFAKLMKQAGVNFGILGAEESCCGDPARRMGQELLFQTHVQRNIEKFKRYNVKRIVTICPHGYNTLKNEYPQFGGDFEVIHHTEFIAELIREGKLKPVRTVDKKVTYHDPCYLGRYNDVYQAPRTILSSIPGLNFIELERSRRESFCCGGGGGHMWLEENVGTRINIMRIQDVIEAEVDILATACPFCLQMMEEGVKRKHVEKSIEVMDISELLQRTI
jgi:Fe-S oxidoreductase